MNKGTCDLPFETLIDDIAKSQNPFITWPSLSKPCLFLLVSTSDFNLLNSMLQKTLPGIDSSVMPLQLLQSLKQPFFHNGVMTPCLQSDCRPIPEENINIAKKVHKVGYNFSADVFIRIAVFAFNVCEIMRNSHKIWSYCSSWSSIVTDLGANQKCICNFLLVINTNFGRISYRFWDMDA